MANLRFGLVLLVFLSHEPLERDVSWQPIETAPRDGTAIEMRMECCVEAYCPWVSRLKWGKAEGKETWVLDDNSGIYLNPPDTPGCRWWRPLGAPIS